MPQFVDGLPVLAGRAFVRALADAHALHYQQIRKTLTGTPVPYLSHLLVVAALVLDDGGTQDEAIAALLHDAVEDAGGERVLAKIFDTYGTEVSALVRGATDSLSPDPQHKDDWLTRKLAYLASIQRMSEADLRLSLADKLHNLQTLLTDLIWPGEKHPEFWTRFKAGRVGTLWYYHSCYEQYLYRRELQNSRLMLQYQTAINQLYAYTVTPDPWPTVVQVQEYLTAQDDGGTVA